MTDPVTQAVVDWVWVYDCIKKSELQGPPNWGGHLLRPKEQEPAITRNKAKEVALAIFGQPQAVEHETVTGDTDAMQLDPAPAAGRSGATPRPDDTQEEEPRGRQMTGSKNQEPGTEGEKSPKDLAQDAVKCIIEEVQQRGGFRIFSPDEMQILVNELYELESTEEPVENWWATFTARRAKDTPEAQRHSIDSWREFYRTRIVEVNKCVQILLTANHPGTDIILKPLRDHSATTTSRYRNRSRSGGRNSNRSARGSDEQTLGTTPGGQASERSSVLSGIEPQVQPKKPGRPRKNPASAQGGLPYTPRKATKNGICKRSTGCSNQAASTATPVDQGAVEDLSYKDRVTLTAMMRFFSSHNESDLRAQESTILGTGIKAILDEYMRRQIGADPTQSSGSEGDTWTSRLKNDWDVISAGALALKGQAGLNRAGAQNRLSHSNDDFTADDHNEMADFIANQIRARRVAKGRETSSLMQNPIWKAFAIVYRTDRQWEDWQTYYRENAEAINNTARKRLEDKSLTTKVAVEMKRLAASGRLNTPPTSGVLKRPPEGELDERHSKHLRL
ncbi:hypothetical protein FRC00_006228 [Tulasnella sp. 408]|nr:hypothetical protein FRC00_006228 [Tulasnella sp. 408]